MRFEMPNPQHSGSIEDGSTFLAKFPPEIFLTISSFLTNRDRKSLRSTCQALCQVTPFSFPRVFLSANPLNIEVFRAISNYPIFRHQVTEIIWDDARFISQPEIPAPLDDPIFNDPLAGLSNLRDALEDSVQGFLTWFGKKCKANLELLRRRICREPGRPGVLSVLRQIEARMPLKKCWKYYSELLKQGQEVIDF